MDEDRRNTLVPVPPMHDDHWIDLSHNNMPPQSPASAAARQEYEHGPRAFLKMHPDSSSGSETVDPRTRTPQTYNVNRNSRRSDSSGEGLDLAMPKTHAGKGVTCQYETEEIRAKIRGAECLDDDYEYGNDDTLHGDITEEMANIGSDRAASFNSSKTLKSTKSVRSAKSAKSVISVKALGVLGFGTLRVHQEDIPHVDSRNICLLNGDVVLMADVPNEATIGYDTTIHTVEQGRPFHGLRELSPGVHFVWGGSNSPTATRNGFWFISQKLATGEAGNCHALTWNRFTDELDEQVVKAAGMFQRREIADVYESCYSYNLKGESSKQEGGSGMSATMIMDEAQLWDDLTFAIKGSMLTRLTGRAWNQWKVTSTRDSVSLNDDGTNVFHNPRDLSNPRMVERTRLNCFEPVLKFAINRGDAPAINSQIKYRQFEEVVDCSHYVEALVANKCGPHHSAEDLIGELQFSYISGMFVGNINCQEHFVFICRVLLKAYDWAIENSFVYAKFIRALTAVLIHDDKNAKGSIFDHNCNFQPELKSLLMLFRHFLTLGLLNKGDYVTRDQIELSKAFEKLEAWLLSKWQWDLRDTSDIKVKKRSLLQDEYAGEEVEAENDRAPKVMKTRILRFCARRKSTLMAIGSSFLSGVSLGTSQ